MMTNFPNDITTTSPTNNTVPVTSDYTWWKIAIKVVYYILKFFASALWTMTKYLCRQLCPCPGAITVETHYEPRIDYQQVKEQQLDKSYNKKLRTLEQELKLVEAPQFFSFFIAFSILCCEQSKIRADSINEICKKLNAETTITRQLVSEGCSQRFKLKNRYDRIVPFNSNRYKMQDKNLREHIPYINASVLYSGDIITQGPLSSTQDDFWFMVWDSGARIIVNATECKEGEKSKCEQYWPANMESSNIAWIANQELMLVSFKDEKNFKTSSGQHTLTLRTFEIQYNDDKRIVYQYHLRGWRDNHDFPLDGITGIIQHIEKHQEKHPAIYHCSAGIGRAGTFYACHQIYQIYKIVSKTGIDINLDLQNLVRLLRHQDHGRPFMINNEDQLGMLYKFHEETQNVFSSQFMW